MFFGNVKYLDLFFNMLDYIFKFEFFYFNMYDIMTLNKQLYNKKEENTNEV